MFDLSVWVFFYVFVGLAGLLQIRLGRLPETTPAIQVEALVAGARIAALALISYEVGRWAKSLRVGRRREVRAEIHESRATYLATASLVFLVYVFAQTGVSAHFTSREALVVTRAAAWPNPTMLSVVTAATLVLPLVSVHALTHIRRKRRQAGLAAGRPLLLAANLLGLLIAVNPFSSPRILFGTAALSLAVLYGFAASRAKFRLLAIALIVSLVALLPLADSFRREGVGFRTASLENLAISGDYDAQGQAANAHLYVNEFGTTAGRQALGAVLFFVPRAAWVDKPNDTGVLLAESRGYSFTNLSAPLWAEGYVNFGFPGVTVFLAALGWACRRGDEAFAASLRTHDWSAVLGAILPFYMLIVLRGSLLQAVATVAMLVVATGVIRQAPGEPVDLS